MTTVYQLSVGLAVKSCCKKKEEPKKKKKKKKKKKRSRTQGSGGKGEGTLEGAEERAHYTVTQNYIADGESHAVQTTGPGGWIWGGGREGDVVGLAGSFDQTIGNTS